MFVASLAALADRTGDPALHREGPARTLRVGDRVDRDELRRTLYALGYDPAPLVSHPGESSLRGDILDFYPFTATAPLRLELFDDEIESLREFDPESQRSTRSLGQILLPAASERPRVVTVRTRYITASTSPHARLQPIAATNIVRTSSRPDSATEIAPTNVSAM